VLCAWHTISPAQATHQGATLPGPPLLSSSECVCVHVRQHSRRWHKSRAAGLHHLSARRPVCRARPHSPPPLPGTPLHTSTNIYMLSYPWLCGCALRPSHRPSGARTCGSARTSTSSRRTTSGSCWASSKPVRYPPLPVLLTVDHIPVQKYFL
jgi:hypothetical protein